MPEMFEFRGQGDPDDEYDTVSWSGEWQNAFECYGVEMASFLSVPAGPEWKGSPYAYSDWPRDPIMKAIEDEDLALVQKLVPGRAEMCHWEGNSMDDINWSTVSRAFQSMSLPVLQHLFSLSPTLFVAMLGMPSGRVTAWQNSTALSVACAQDSYNSYGKYRDDEELHDSLLEPIMRWLCRRGLMTMSIVEQCTAHFRGKEIQNQYATKKKMPPRAAAELARWRKLSLEDQQALTMGTFAGITMCGMPWRCEKVLWVGRGEERSPLSQLPPGVMKLIVMHCRLSPSWLEYRADDVRAEY